MRNWNELSMAEKADIMKLAIEGGVYDLDSIRNSYNKFAEGGGIHIKDSKKGTFTAAATKHGMGVQEFASKVLAHPENYSPAMRKKANFARNAAKWHGDGGNLFEIGGQKRPAKRNRFADMSIEELKEVEKTNEEYWERKQKELDNRTPEQIRQMGIKADKEYRKRNPNSGEADPNLQRSANVVMSALSDIANSTPFTGSEIAEAADNQRQEKLNKWHNVKLGMDASMTAAELAAAGYGVVRGLTHANRWLARQATQSTGQAISREAMQNLLKWNNRVDKIDKAQVAMNTLGGAADGYQWATADNSFDAWENGLETGANAAGVVGGMNWFRDLPYLRRIGGDKIDAVLDGLGYSAAAWDIVKNLPPLSTALEERRRNSNNDEKAFGGNLFEDGGLLDWIKGIFSSENDKPTKEPIYRGSPAEKITIFNDGKKYSAYAPKRINENNSKTRTQSERLENRMRATIRMDQTKKASDPAYDIPYLPEKSILINGSTTSTNVLDSLAKYAGMHNSSPQLSQYPIKERSEYKEPRRISKDEMLGLAVQETNNGAMPYFNFKERQPVYNRSLANSNYLTAFGSIPAEYLVRNYQYNDAGVDRSTPPLLDAFRYYAQGDYNRKSRGHMENVRAKGREAWKNPKVKEWWEKSGKYWYDKGAGNK